LFQRLGSAVFAAVLAAGLLTACSDSEDPVSKETESRTLAFRGCDEVECEGQIAGAAYQVQMPQTWNGTLLLYSHGYRQAEPSPPSFAPVQTDAIVASTEETAAALLKAGYALAGSAYARNGWAVADGVKAGDDLYRWFRKNVGEPDRVYVWGDSLGGLITQILAEKYPEWVSGAAPMCGVLGGLNLNLDLALDLEYAVKTLIYPEMQVTGFASHTAAVQTFQEAQKRILAAARDLKNGVPKLLTIAAITDGPAKTGRFDGSTPTSQVSALVEAMLTGLGYATFGRYEIEQRVGGNPSTNTEADYGKRVTAAERTLSETISPGAMDRALAALAAGERIAADPDARDAADALGSPTGDLQDKTMTMHTVYDPLVLVQNEKVFGDLVNKSSRRKSDLVQVFIQPPPKYAAPAPYGAGHCNFTVNDRVGLIRALDEWVRNGVYPAAPNISRAMQGSKGFNPGYLPPPWPATASG
jgi:pimeloyl-ACP methyl ester carboxylesterase